MIDVPAVQREIARDLQVDSHFDADAELDRRVDFLANAIAGSNTRALVLGISGGIDSTTTGRLCQLAVERVRERGGVARFFAVRLPYGQQADAADAEAAIAFIRPDETFTVDIKTSVDAVMDSLMASGYSIAEPALADFVRGNVKARERMVVQYVIANAERGLVVGTDHAAEAVMGFFTKFGDGACDVAPLTGLTKRRVRALGSLMGAPMHLVGKVPTADLESLSPLKPDELALGVTYDAIDDFLELKPVPESDAASIIETYRRTAHKRVGPAGPQG